MESQAKSFKKVQPIVAIAIVIILIIWGSQLQSQKAVLAVQLLSGVLLGAALTRARFGFAGGIKRIFVRGEGSLTKSLLIMFVVTMLLFFGVQWLAAQNGAVPAFRAGEGDIIIPGTQNVKFANLATVIGGILFGIGMIFAGGCASGTLTDMGEGEGRAMLAFIFFILGSAPGEWARYAFDQGALGKVGTQIYFPDYFGYFGALLVSLVIVFIIYFITVKYENKRKDEGTYLDPYGDWEAFEKPLEDNFKKSSPVFGFNVYHKLFVERFTFAKGAVLVAIICSLILLTTGKPWGVTSAFSLLDVAVLKNFGLDFSSPAFAEINEKVSTGLLNDGGTIRNMGIVFGSLLAFLFAGRFSFKFKFDKKDAVYYMVGGLLMGFGARLAKGCNAGAMYSAIATFSISGWVFALAMVIGGLIALKAFAGKMSLIPAARKK